MTENTQHTIPSGYELRVNNPGTNRAAWVLGADYDGIGFVGEATRPVTTTVPGDDVAVWAAEQLEVTGVILAASGVPQTWSIEITTD